MNFSLVFFRFRRRFISTPYFKSDHFRRSDFTGQGFTGFYEPGQPTPGPLGDASAYGAPKVTPRVLEQHLSNYIVGQERAKRIMSVAVYNHYQRVQELQRREDEAEALFAQQQRRAMNQRHPVEDEFPGQQVVYNAPPAPSPSPPSSRIGTAPIVDQTPLNIEKSNVLLLGPSGVGKTLIAKTLARVLEVPFSMSDCTPFTQAGYIGEDVEVCVQRLLAAANYDVAAAERGIIVLDEIDKIATARVSHGKDVSGEGVQQALLKIIEGTTVQVQAKQERGSATPSSRGQGATTGGSSSGPTNSPLSGGSTVQAPQKGETYNVNTDNILFICSGAFIGLHKVVMERIAKGSIGFGARVQATARPLSSNSSSGASENDPTIPAGIPENDELFRKHLPFFAEYPTNGSATTTANKSRNESKPTYNTLDLLTPSDLHRYGLIPELTGRLPISASLNPLTTPQLIRVLTEPRHALLSQYSSLFSLSGIELRFTTAALHAIAEAAASMGTGARGLRTVMERSLGDAMFEAPGSGVRHVLIRESAVRGKEKAAMFAKEGKKKFWAALQREEEDWQRSQNDEQESAEGQAGRAGAVGFSSFEQYREKAKVAGVG
ncbi:MAG: hypothetical protein M1831_004917 [Alyxoria varia]|nr:MAG: hypothetical protein M1831_004917 [Alyxoria varia]